MVLVSKLECVPSWEKYSWSGDSTSAEMYVYLTQVSLSSLHFFHAWMSLLYHVIYRACWLACRSFILPTYSSSAQIGNYSAIY